MVEVFLVDDNGRRVLNGYGSSYLPCSAGYEELLIHTWRPADKSVKGKLRNWLLGTGPELNEPEAIISSSTQQRWVHSYQGYLKIHIQAKIPCGVDGNDQTQALHDNKEL